MDSNIAEWQALQEANYFENHPCYGGFIDHDKTEMSILHEFFNPLPKMNAVIIGCGYGRDASYIAPLVKQVYGIDVSDTILNKAVHYLNRRGIYNFTPVLAENYKSLIPFEIDLVFSIVVMQHLTRDLVRDYFNTLAGRLSPNGAMIIQFAENLYGDKLSGEPSITWTVSMLRELAAECYLNLDEIKTMKMNQGCLWHWTCFRRI